MKLTEEQIAKYSRNIRLNEVGAEGQIKLLESKVLIIGAGGLGSPAALYLAAAGIGKIGLVDPDIVELSNLQRQIIHAKRDVGKLKVLSGKETIRAMNPDVEVITYREWADSVNMKDIIMDEGYDFIVDATDNFSSKFEINDACVSLQKPFSHAGVMKLMGQTMTYVPGMGPCYRCVFLDSPPVNTASASQEVGVLGVIPGVLGTIQATETIKFLLGIGKLLTGKLLVFDALTMEFTTLDLAGRNDCPACGENKK